jgi:hypothetical protein
MLSDLPCATPAPSRVLSPRQHGFLFCDWLTKRHPLDNDLGCMQRDERSLANRLTIVLGTCLGGYRAST